MRFTSNIASFITTGLLATSAIAGVIPSSDATKSIRRRDDEDWAEIARKHCPGDTLFRRDDVPTDTGKGANSNTPLSTFGLSTCVGMVATGTLKEGQQGNNHFLAHISIGNDDGWEQFKSAVSADKDKLDGLTGYITTAKDTLTSDSVKKLLEEDGEDTSDDNVEEFKEFLTEEYDRLKGELESLVGSVKEEPHGINDFDGGNMESNGKGEVKVNGKVIS